MRMSHLGKPLSEETKAKLSAAHKGKKHTPETRAKLAETTRASMTPERRAMNMHWKGKTLPEETRLKLSLSHIGHTQTPETREKIGFAFRGEKHPAWKGGISFEPYCPKWTKDLRNRIRAFFEYRCLMCGKSTEDNKKQLSCHHVTYNKEMCCDGKPVCFAALCHSCHAKTNNRKTQWEAMLHRIIDEIYQGRSYYTKEEMKGMVNNGE
jgi:hypothetical protein